MRQATLAQHGKESNFFRHRVIIATALLSALSTHAFTSTHSLTSRTIHSTALCSREFMTHKSFAPIPPFQHSKLRNKDTVRASPTALNIWWYGGSDMENNDPNADECELVAVQIERTSANSRRIMGDIVVPTSLDDVWAILTDYDNLATHVPNLVESRQIAGAVQSGGHQGDGSYKCRLYQKGAQKIVGFEFGASVTMDMCEGVTVAGNGGSAQNADAVFQEERRIGFKCVESPFFSEFDGEWVARRTPEIALDGSIIDSTTLTYVVDVRPRGPVPVAPLEWRIREDVPTNLRAVKKAALEVGYEGVMSSRGIFQESMETAKSIGRDSTNRARSVLQNVGQNVKGRMQRAADIAASSRARTSNGQRKLAPVYVTWDDDETMAAYLSE